MRLLFLLLALGLMSPVHAALITYAYTHTISNTIWQEDDRAYDAAALFIVDDQKRGLVSAAFASDPISFAWTGFAPLLHEQPVSSAGQLYDNGFRSVIAGDFFLDLWLDLFWLDAGEDIFHHLDRGHPGEGAFVGNWDTGPVFMFDFPGQLIKLTTVEVPEPSPLALLTLGLVGVVYSRRRRLIRFVGTL